MSDTPRTDALIAEYPLAGSTLGKGIRLADHSRELERELAEARAERDALRATFQLKQNLRGWQVIVTTPNGDCHEFRALGEHANRVLRDAAAALDAHPNNSHSD